MSQNKEYCIYKARRNDKESISFFTIEGRSKTQYLLQYQFGNPDHSLHYGWEDKELLEIVDQNFVSEFYAQKLRDMRF